MGTQKRCAAGCSEFGLTNWQSISGAKQCITACQDYVDGVECVSTCAQQKFSYVNVSNVIQKVCQLSCGQQSVNLTNISATLCLASCPWDFPVITPTGCLAVSQIGSENCKYLEEQTFKCLGECANLVQIRDQIARCVAQCSADRFQYEKNCVSTCAPDRFGNLADRKCTEKCTDQLYSLVQGGLCVQSCGSQYLGQCRDCAPMPQSGQSCVVDCLLQLQNGVCNEPIKVVGPILQTGKPDTLQIALIVVLSVVILGVLVAIVVLARWFMHYNKPIAGAEKAIKRADEMWGKVVKERVGEAVVGEGFSEIQGDGITMNL